MKKHLSKSSIIVFAILVTAFLIGYKYDFLEKHAMIVFVKENNLSKTPPDYVGEAISIDGNLLSLKSYDTSDLPISKIESFREKMEYVHNLTAQEQKNLKIKLRQNYSGNVEVLIAPETMIYRKEDGKAPKKTNTDAIKNNDTLLIWVDLEKADYPSAKIIIINTENDGK